MSIPAQAGPAPMAPRGAAAIAALLLVLLGVALYAPSLSSRFVDFDDRKILLAHPARYDENSLLASARRILVDDFPREEPLLLRDLTWAVDARVFGFRNPLGYHLGNVAWNAVVGALLFWFLLRATRRFWLAFGVAACWAVLPVHVEAVSWVMGRKDVLSSALVLLALLAQTFELERGATSRRRWLAWGAGLACTMLALVAKVGAFPCVALLGLHRVFHAHLSGERSAAEPIAWRETLVRSLPRLVPHALATAAIVVWYQRVLAEFGVVGRNGPDTLSPEHLANLARFVPLVVASYLRSLVWPGELSAYYRWPHVEIPLSAAEQVAAIASALTITAGVAFCCLRRRDLAFWPLAFCATLAPYVGIVFVDIWRADRYVYLASFAPLALAGVLLGPAWRRGRLARAGITSVVACFFAVSAARAWQQQAVWRDNTSLWRYEASRTEPSLLALRALADDLADQAEREPDAEHRAALLGEARREALRGIERERALGRVTTGYRTNEQLQLARLHALLGRIDRLDGAPLERQIDHYVRSYRLAPSHLSARALAQLVLERARHAPDAEKELLVKTSFQYFVAYLAHTAHDPAWRERNGALLENVYEKNYPYLASAADTARRTYLR